MQRLCLKQNQTQMKKKVLVSTCHTQISRVVDHEEYRESWIHICSAHNIEGSYESSWTTLNALSQKEVEGGHRQIKT